MTSSLWNWLSHVTFETVAARADASAILACKKVISSHSVVFAVSVASQETPLTMKNLIAYSCDSNGQPVAVSWRRQRIARGKVPMTSEAHRGSMFRMWSRCVSIRMPKHHVAQIDERLRNAGLRVIAKAADLSRLSADLRVFFLITLCCS